MFEDRTYENIMAEMMASAPDGINTSEGSLFWNACAEQAVRLEEAYYRMAQIEKNMYVDTADIEHLIRNGNERGIIMKSATYSTFKAQFNIAVPEGTVFENSRYTYTVFTPLDEEQHIYLIGCDTPGAEPNGVFEDVSPVEYIDGFELGKILSVDTQGTDEESEESYRSRLMQGYDPSAFAGNRSYYKGLIKQISGVGGVKVKRVRYPTDYIDVIIMGDDYMTPSETLIKKIKEYVDPLSYEGEGYGIAPIGHKVNIIAAQEQMINIKTSISYEDGYSYDVLKSKIKNAVESYFESVRKDWEDKKTLVIRILQIEAAIVSVDGVIDVQDTSINDAFQNLTVPEEMIPILGGFVCK